MRIMDFHSLSRKNLSVAVAIYVVCAAVFVFDITSADTIAFGVFYLPMVGTAVFYRDPRVVWLLAGIATVMVVVGYFLPYVDENMVETTVNRGASIVAIFVTAGLLHYTRRTQEALARQTLRAERGDQAKTRLLTNLSRELISPVNSIIRFSELIQEDCRDDQREFIGYVHDSGTQLLNTFRNLIDVTGIERRHLQAVTVNLRPLLDNAVRSSLVAAAEQRVSITLALCEAPLEVRADPWAVKRILENLLGNAVKFSNPDGQVTVSATAQGDQIDVVVRDRGVGMIASVLSRLGELFFQADTGASRKFAGMGAGLALSMRLAVGMGGKLQFESKPGGGTTATLTLKRGGLSGQR